MTVKFNVGTYLFENRQRFLFTEACMKDKRSLLLLGKSFHVPNVLCVAIT